VRTALLDAKFGGRLFWTAGAFAYLPARRAARSPGRQTPTDAGVTPPERGAVEQRLPVALLAPAPMTTRARWRQTGHGPSGVTLPNWHRLIPNILTLPTQEQAEHLLGWDNLVGLESCSFSSVAALRRGGVLSSCLSGDRTRLPNTRCMARFAYRCFAARARARTPPARHTHTTPRPHTPCPFCHTFTHAPLHCTHLYRTPPHTLPPHAPRLLQQQHGARNGSAAWSPSPHTVPRTWCTFSIL